jgi:hypothetical protein
MIILAFNNKVVEVRFTEDTPEIDGVIEELWEISDSAYDFVQSIPYEKKPPNENTVVYVLQDDENLYFAFRCYAKEHPPIACFTGNEDYIKIGIDPFGSRNTAYYFTVYASEIRDDGRREDDSWDGVWYRAVKLYNRRFEVEVKIPFKSIRYKKGLNKWGIQFVRFIAEKRETDYWTEVLQIEEFMVSKFGKLKGIKPYSTGYYFELFPEGFLRYDKIREEEGKFKPRLSLNFKWDLTSEATLTATTFPDFAQIEADPFELNLGQYPTYLDERRPFFLEGKEIFRMSDFGEGMGFFKPLDIFYSRKVGRSIDGEVIPIIGGLKFTNKSEKWNIGALTVYTDEYSENDVVIEPRRGFGALRLKHKVLDNSDVGMLFSGTILDKHNYNYAVGIDGVYRKEVSQLIIQSALSDKNGKKGWAVSSGYFGWIGKFMSIINAEVVQDSFDVSGMGYVPWTGRQKFLFLSGPFKTYQKGFLMNLFWGPAIMAVKEPGNPNWSKVIGIMINPNFRNDWGFNVEATAGSYYEVDTNYFHRDLSCSVWGNGPKYTINFGVDYRYSYNYWRGFLAYQGSNWITYYYSVTPQVSLILNANLWIEWDPANTLIATTSMLTPRIEYRINADMKIAIFNEFVVTMPRMNFSETELLSNRLGVLFSWNFKPKSWLYIALNDYRTQNETGDLELRNQIGAIKVKYLLYF